jgi:S-DNA-T family DNA segregation ATPase FtsK/SpoIIIE
MIMARLSELARPRRQELAGILLFLLGIFSAASMLWPAPGVMMRAWQSLLAELFGWGLFVVPIALVVIGSWLLLRNYRERMPRIELRQVIGLALLYLVLLASLHAALGVSGLDEAISRALEGRGGGLIGGGTLGLSLDTLGGAGTAVALLAAVVLGICLVSGRSVPELSALAFNGLDRLRLKVAPAGMDRGFVPMPEPMPTAASPHLAPGMSELDTQPDDEPVIDLGIEAKAPEWKLPEMADILEQGAEGKADDEFDRQRARLIEDTLRAFGAPGRVVETHRGPTITQFGVEPDFVDGRAGKRTKVKVSKISALADDLALALAAQSIRVEAPVPGKGYVGIEVPNPEIELVALRDIVEAESFRKFQSPLALGLGRDVSGHPIAADLAGMPHLLIAGTTGSGKSVCVNAIVACLLMQNTPDSLKFVMVDPKRVELTFYNGIPHLLAPVVVELERVVPALQWVSREMDKRYHDFAREGVRNIGEFNTRLRAEGKKELYYLVVVIDELADLMMLAPDETERVITRLAQLARATGIHLVIATQRPSVDVVTGLIKANFPARIAFAVASSVDSRVILDQPGAERLLGRGDMLFQSPDSPAPVRMQGAFVSEPELSRLIGFWKDAATEQLASAPAPASTAPALPAGAPLKQAPLWEELAAEDEDLDSLFDEAVSIVRGMRRASISLLQRRMRIGYTRSARLVDQLEDRGIIGPAKEGSQAREVLDYGDLGTEDEA